MNRKLAADIVGLYERHAAEYDRKRGRSLFEKPWLDRFLALVPQGGHVLDLGCGTGRPMAQYLLEQGVDVTGVDASPTLVDLCRQRLPGGTWLAADMRGLRLGRGFHGLLAWDSFFHLTQDDQRAMFRVFADHALPGAALLFTTGPDHGEAVGVFEGHPLYHASLSPLEYRGLLHRAGFAVAAHTAEDPTCGGHTVWLARRQAGPAGD